MQIIAEHVFFFFKLYLINITSVNIFPTMNVLRGKTMKNRQIKVTDMKIEKKSQVYRGVHGYSETKYNVSLIFIKIMQIISLSLSLFLLRILSFKLKY